MWRFSADTLVAGPQRFVGVNPAGKYPGGLELSVNVYGVDLAAAGADAGPFRKTNASV